MKTSFWRRWCKSLRSASRPAGIARQAAAAPLVPGGARGPRHAVADAADGPGHQHDTLSSNPSADRGDRLDHLLRRGRRRARRGAVEERRHRRRHRAGQGHQPRQRSARTPGNLTNVNGTLFFTANDGTHGYELWKSDGTAAGTVLVKDINPGRRLVPASPDERQRHAVLRGLRRMRRATSCGRATARPPAPRWSRTSTPAAASSDPSQPDERQRHAVLRGLRRHRRAGAVEERRHRRRHRPGQGHRPRASATALVPSDLTNVNGTLFFSADDGTHGVELWKSDGTAAGTVARQGHLPRQRRLVPQLPHERQRDAVLHGSDGATGGSCGRATAPPPAPCSSRTSAPASTPSDLTNVNGTLFFAADDARPAASCGRATAPPPAPCWSRTSSPAAPVGPY